MEHFPGQHLSEGTFVCFPAIPMEYGDKYGHHHNGETWTSLNSRVVRMVETTRNDDYGHDRDTPCLLQMHRS